MAIRYLTYESHRVYFLNNLMPSQSKTQNKGILIRVQPGFCIQVTHRSCDMSQDAFGNRFLSSLLQLVEASRHQFHADPDFGLGDEAAQALNDLRAAARLEHHIQVHRDSFGLFVVPSSVHLLRREKIL